MTVWKPKDRAAWRYKFFYKGVPYQGSTGQLTYEDAKSAANQAKHGIDFVDAQALWNDPNRLEVPARFVREPRVMIVGRIADTLWSAIITYRHEKDTIRIISVRRARDAEGAHYARRDDRDQR